MPKNAMKLLKPSRNVGRNAFDLSHRHVMTANFGELLPITCIETVPGDYVEFRVSDLLRAMPMVTSPFLRAKQHIDVWYTSYDDLWHNFEQFITQKNQPVSSALGKSGYCPHASLSDLYAIANGKNPANTSQSYVFNLTTDVVGRGYKDGAIKLLDFLGYGQNYVWENPSNAPKVNIWRLLQYNKIWYDEYRQKYYDTGMRGLSESDDFNPSFLFNVDDLVCDSVAHSDLTATKSTAGLGYQRMRAMMQMRYRCWKKDLYTGALPNTQFGNVSTLPILDGLLIQNQVFTNQDINGDDSDEATYGKYLVSGKDTDRWYSVAQSVPSSNVAAGFYGSNRDTSTLFADLDSPNAMEHNHAINVASHLGVSSSVTSTGGLDVLALRKAEALQIWRENALRAGNRISDNMRAHYGDDAEYNDHRSTLLGSVSASLNIMDIDAHAQTGTGGNEQLADVAGKGLSSTDEKVFKFKAHKFGCIMVMFSMLPEAEYQSDGIDRMNQLLESEDYFVSEYQNTGLEAISVANFDSTNTAGVVGYAPKYYGYKTKLDKCFNFFKSNEVFQSWASPKTDVGAGSYNLNALATLYVNPCLFNRNFGIAVTGTPGLESDVSTTEQFLCDFYFQVDAVRAMSVVGLPQNL